MLTLIIEPIYKDAVNIRLARHGYGPDNFSKELAWIETPTVAAAYICTVPSQDVLTQIFLKTMEVEAQGNHISLEDMTDEDLANMNFVYRVVEE